jgi:hypothetical protein
MRCLPLVCLLIALVACCTSQAVDKDVAGESSRRIVGSVYEKPVTADDIELRSAIDPNVQFDARDGERWNLMGRILTAFGKPVVDRFVEAKRIDATAEEIKACQDRLRQSNEQSVEQMEERLEKVNAELASSTLRDENAAKLEKERTFLENILPTLRHVAKQTPSEEIARQLVVASKIEQALYRTYGGRVIFQQAGPEALDARRRLFEEAEESGDLKFEDAGVHHMFYYYYVNMKHVVISDDAIEQVWSGEKSQ